MLKPCPHVCDTRSKQKRHWPSLDTRRKGLPRCAMAIILNDFCGHICKGKSRPSVIVLPSFLLASVAIETVMADSIFRELDHQMMYLSISIRQVSRQFRVLQTND